MLEVQTEGLLAEAGRERVKRDAVRHRKEQYEHVRHGRCTAMRGGDSRSGYGSWQEWGRRRQDLLRQSQQCWGGAAESLLLLLISRLLTLLTDSSCSYAGAWPMYAFPLHAG
jgi:hypothetical protein